MASCDDVRRIALALPHIDEEPSRRGLAFWRVKGQELHLGAGAATAGRGIHRQHAQDAGRTGGVVA